MERFYFWSVRFGFLVDSATAILLTSCGQGRGSEASGVDWCDGI